MLETIPIYRMTLKPHSYLPLSNEDTQYENLVCELPNTQNIHRKKEISLLPLEKHEFYYLAQLLLETKRFCREMLYNCSIDATPFEEILRGQSIDLLFALIEQKRTTFFKYIVLNDLKTFKLFKGYLESDIKRANSVEDIIKNIKRYGVLSKLFRVINQDYQNLKAIYC